MGESLMVLGGLVGMTALVGLIAWVSVRLHDGAEKAREDRLVRRVTEAVLEALPPEELARRVARGARSLDRR